MAVLNGSVELEGEGWVERGEGERGRGESGRGIGEGELSGIEVIGMGRVEGE